MLTFIIALTAAVAVGSLVAAVTMAIRGDADTAAEDRLMAMARKKGVAGPAAASTSLMYDETEKKWLDEVLHDIPGLGMYIQQANAKVTPVQFVGMCVGLFTIGTIATLGIPVPKLLAPITGLILASIPLAWLIMKRKRRLGKFGNQMPEALELLSRSLRAGHSLGSGMGLIAKEMDEPINIEFARAFEEQNLGISLEESLENMTHRIPNLDLRFFATAVVLQRTTGGDLAEILDKISHLIRERIKIFGQVAALTGEGRLSGIVLLALPPVLFLVMLYINSEYMMMLFTHPLGRKMTAGALVMQLLGALAIKKIVTIKV
jgi:tight adherence protein B